MKTEDLSKRNQLPPKRNPPPKCEYQGKHFGADYEDACCIDGYLWDLDSCEYPGGPLYHGGKIPCPNCNSEAHNKYISETDQNDPSNKTANELLDAAGEIGGICGSNCHYTALLANRVEQTGKPVTDLTVGELIALHHECSEHFNTIWR